MGYSIRLKKVWVKTSDTDRQTDRRTDQQRWIHNWPNLLSKWVQQPQKFVVQKAQRQWLWSFPSFIKIRKGNFYNFISTGACHWPLFLNISLCILNILLWNPFFGPRVLPRGSLVITLVRLSVVRPSLNISEAVP